MRTREQIESDADSAIISPIYKLLLGVALDLRDQNGEALAMGRVLYAMAIERRDAEFDRSTVDRGANEKADETTSAPYAATD